MDNNLKKCLRCNVKEAVFSCISCDSFNLLCTQCDSYVHGLPSKKKHRRNALKEDHSEAKIYMNTINTNNNNSYHSQNGSTNKSMQQEYTNDRYKTTNEHLNMAQSAEFNSNKNNNSIKNYSYSKDNSGYHKEPIIVEDNTHTSIDKSFLTNKNYSREYINEIKVIYYFLI